ncbi:hypothetical protein AVEN_122688-1 [Araneus ventricosus]|uniref:Baculoviridae p74 N-terminal domain-containing protein n=1 Tax=Araneus ventricosus TaxID=182803 RepID=A0A4Y2PC12_ARAVE|nr:hypothetical protein AVEN_122688-1 [Araneus ventricosus]
MYSSYELEHATRYAQELTKVYLFEKYSASHPYLFQHATIETRPATNQDYYVPQPIADNCIVVSKSAFDEIGCQKASCFSFKENLEPCEEDDDPRWIPIGKNFTLGCQPICRLQKGILTRFQNEKCVLENTLKYLFALFPEKVSGMKSKHNFHTGLDIVDGHLKMNELYCKAFGTQFDGNDCVTDFGQKIGEIFLGSAVYREIFITKKTNPSDVVPPPLPDYILNFPKTRISRSIDESVELKISLSIAKEIALELSVDLGVDFSIDFIANVLKTKVPALISKVSQIHVKHAMVQAVLDSSVNSAIFMAKSVDKHGNQIYKKNKDGDENYAAVKDVNKIFARKANGTQFYAKYKKNEIYPYVDGIGIPIMLKNGKKIYAEKNGGKQFYPKDKNDNEMVLTDENLNYYYAKDAGKNEYYPKMANGREFMPRNDMYARTSTGKFKYPVNEWKRPIYPRNQNGRQFYLIDPVTKKPIFAEYMSNQYYAKDQNDDEYYPENGMYATNNKGDSIYAVTRSGKIIYPKDGDDNEFYLNGAVLDSYEYLKTLDKKYEYAKMQNGAEIYPKKKLKDGVYMEPYLKEYTTVINVELDKEGFEEAEAEFPVECMYDHHELSHIGDHGYTSCAANIADVYARYVVNKKMIVGIALLKNNLL